MKSNGEKPRAQLDLGLSQILSTAGAERAIDASPEDHTAPSSNQGTYTQPPQWVLGDQTHHDGVKETVPAQARSEFDALADERNWTEIVKRVELRIVDPNDLEARLWWIRGHLGAFSLPVAFLAAPMETVCRWARGRPLPDALTTLMRETGMIVLERLQEVGERDLAHSLRASLRSVGIVEPKGPRGRARRATSSFRSVEFQGLSPSHTTTESVGSTEVRQGKGMAILLLVIGLLAVVSFTQREGIESALFPELLGRAHEDFARDQFALDQMIPTSQRRDPGSRLGAVFYSFEAAPSGSDATGRAAQGSGVGASDDKSTRGSSSGQSGGDGGETPSDAPDQHDSVNVKGPIEGEEFRNGIGKRGGAQADDPRPPLEGGPPAAVLPEADTPGFEVERIYRVLGHTDILSAPSFGGRPIGTLEYGDRVLGNGRLGRWIRLRSRQGRGGYVLAEDVEELSEGDSNSGKGADR